jgi:hypothetical protein
LSFRASLIIKLTQPVYKDLDDLNSNNWTIPNFPSEYSAGLFSTQQDAESLSSMDLGEFMTSQDLDFLARLFNQPQNGNTGVPQ